MLTARCPVNRDHNKFVTVAHVQQEWVVSEHGDFLEVGATIDVTAGPDSDNVWRCALCNADAVVTTSRHTATVR